VKINKHNFKKSVSRNTTPCRSYNLVTVVIVLYTYTSTSVTYTSTSKFLLLRQVGRSKFLMAV